MTSNKPVLYLFSISHFCEKARWALDYLGIEYELRHVAPGEHGQIAKRLGAPRTSVPYLAVDDGVIQGSSEIVSWAESQNSSASTLLTTDAEACDEIESRIGAIAGVHVRRFYYSEAIVEHPATVRPIFTRELGMINKLKIRLGWGKIRKIMIARMDLGEAQGEESQAIVDAELAWIDGLLSDGRAYLVGDSFSRADIAVASILSPLVLPPEHSVYNRIDHPPKMAETLSAWSERPALRWVRDIYTKHR